MYCQYAIKYNWPDQIYFGYLEGIRLHSKIVFSFLCHILLGDEYNLAPSFNNKSHSETFCFVQQYLSLPLQWVMINIRLDLIVTYK